MNSVLLSMMAVMAVSVICGWFLRNRKEVSTVIPVCMAILAVLCGIFCYPILGGETVDEGAFYVDSLSSVFMMLVAIIGCTASFYSRAYIGLELEEGKIENREHGTYYLLIAAFVSIMILTFTVRSMAIVWIGIGATTIVSTFLVGFYHSDEATEASWKYIILCSVGITLALAGMTLVYAAGLGYIDSDSAFDWPALMAVADSLDPTMMKMAMTLIIIGFGTKVGFAPLHSWLPDAHSQAPSPVSGLLSAVLLNCALYGILRFYAVSEIAIPGFASTMLLIFGFISLFAAAFFIITSKDLKRMLAYSSIENMGLIAIGFGIGTPLAISAAIIQMVAHSVTKPILFFSAGNIIQSYGTRTMDEIHGVSKKMPLTSFLMAAGTLAIVGAPPFAVFIGELSLISSSLDSGMYWAAGLMIVLLSVVFAGFVRHVFPMLSGDTDRNINPHHSYCRYVPIVFLLVCTLIAGLFMPETVQNWLNNAVSVLEVF